MTTISPMQPRLFRTAAREVSPRRLLRGGRLDDAGRLPRYLLIFALGALAIWTPILIYLNTAPLSFTSKTSLILPGSGASASLNLESIGQASSYANSPFTSTAVSPTETYKRLLSAERILTEAARRHRVEKRHFGKPRVELVDQTGLIHISVTGPSAKDAQARGQALLQAFFAEIDKLRADEIDRRERGAGDTIVQYRQSVLATRAEITKLQRKTGLISADQYQTLVAETDKLAERVRDLTVALQEKTESVTSLTAALGTSPRQAAAALRLHADTDFAALARMTSEKAAELAKARGRYGDSHPEMVTARAGHEAAWRDTLARARDLTGLTMAELETLDMSHVGSRADLLSRLVTLDASREGLAAELAAMTERLGVAESRRQSLIAPAARLEDLQRDFSVAEAVFASAMARNESTKSDLFASYPLVQMLEDPSLPDRPTSPRRMLAIAAGAAAMICLFGGLLLGWIRKPLIDRLLVSGTVAQPHSSMVPAE